MCIRDSIKEHGDMSTGKGAGIGALIGGVIGILGGPAGIAIGAGAGAAIGGVAAHSDAGFSNDTLNKIGIALPAGTSALAVTTSSAFVEEVRKAQTGQESLTMAQQISDEISGNLNAGQDVLMAMVLTEDGVAATKVVSTDEALAVFGIAASEDGVVAGGVAAGPDGAVAVGAAVIADDGTDSGDDSADDGDSSSDDSASDSADSDDQS